MKSNIFFDKLIELAIQEDIGAGDFSSLSCIPGNKFGKAKLLVKQNGIIAGVDIAKKIFHIIDSDMIFEHIIEDGTVIEKGNIAFYVEGKVQSILKSERLVLNILQRMSGIATTTYNYVKEISGTKSKILDTRKTTPGFRIFEKEAVRIGGGYNHRMGLFDMIMLKDNHIDFAGGIELAIDKTIDYLKTNNLNLNIEIETRNISDVERVLKHGKIHRIMLDNFSIPDTKIAIQLIGNKYETESSGGITIENIRKYAECGVDYISVGALTHQINSLDLSLKAI